jgi:hypothetical protein
MYYFFLGLIVFGIVWFALVLDEAIYGDKKND